MKVVDSHVDALTLRFRCTPDPLFVAALQERGHVALRHGRAAFHWRNRVPVGAPASGSRNGPMRLSGLRARWAEETTGETEDVSAVWGELRYSRTHKVWNIIREPDHRIRIDLNAPGATDRFDETTGERTHEGGWTVEIIFYAQWLAVNGLELALREGEAIASLIGDVHEKRLGRIDLAADIAGWTIGEDDVKRLVKRPRARWQKEYGDLGVGADGVPRELRKKPGRATKVERDEEVGAQDFGRGAMARRQITGLSVGRGGAMMTRIYDKRVELERDEQRRVNQEKRWRDMGGWDGVEGVTRVEFQIRGTVISEFGIRNPDVAEDLDWKEDERGRMRIVGHKPCVDEDGVVLGLVDRLDWLWRSCLEWVKLVEPTYSKNGKLKPVSRWEDDERWALLREVTFAKARAPSPIKRFRVRSAASAAMGLGVALSQAARAGELEEWSELTGSYDEETAPALLRARVEKLKKDEAQRIILDLERRGGGVLGALAHLAVRNNAARARHAPCALEEEVATGPPFEAALAVA